MQTNAGERKENTLDENSKERQMPGGMFIIVLVLKAAHSLMNS